MIVVSNTSPLTNLIAIYQLLLGPRRHCHSRVLLAGIQRPRQPRIWMPDKSIRA